jgi:hypothetical protein
MAQETDIQLKVETDLIKNEVTANANTASRIGTTLGNIVDSKANNTDVALKAPIVSPTFTGTVGGVTKSMVGLGNVDNTSDVNKPVSTAQQAAIAAAVVGLYDDRGNYDASGNTYPALGGSGTAGAILKGDIWYISVSGTSLLQGGTLRALIDTPGQTSGNWAYVASLNITFALQAEVETASPTENTKSLNALRAFQGFAYWVVNSTFSGLNTTSKTIQGAINELKTSYDPLNPLLSQTFSGQFNLSTNYEVSYKIYTSNTSLTPTLAASPLENAVARLVVNAGASASLATTNMGSPRSGSATFTASKLNEIIVYCFPDGISGALVVSHSIKILN